ncbi:MAG: GNAT family N-acetyltransferase [Chitinophagaceae bacterium]
MRKSRHFLILSGFNVFPNPDGACFGLYHSDTLIGITGIVISKENPQAAFLTQSFICPEQRGKGLSALLYEARIAWAVARGLSTLVVGHRKDNRVSRSANQRFGFTYAYEEECTWGDGKSDTLLWYRLELT